eukprot:PhM_4_TR15406/c0_g1_i1/m.8621
MSGFLSLRFNLRWLDTTKKRKIIRRKNVLHVLLNTSNYRLWALRLWGAVAGRRARIVEEEGRGLRLQRLRLADAVRLEPEAAQSSVVEDKTAVEDERGLVHALQDAAVVVRLELVPLREHNNSVRTLACLVGVGDDVGVARDLFGGDAGVFEVLDDLALGHLRVVDVEVRALLQQGVAHEDGRGLARVAGVLLERKAEDGDGLAGDGVKHRLHDLLGEAAALVVVDVDNLVPVVRHFGQIEALAQIHQVEDIFLETRPAEADRCLQELGAQAAVVANGAAHLVDVGAGLLAQSADGIDGRNALRQEGVRGQLGEFRRPHVRRDDALVGHPAAVHAGEHVHGGLAGRVALTTDKDAVRHEKVVDGGALSEELRVGQDREGCLAADRVHDLADGGAAADGHG